MYHNVLTALPPTAIAEVRDIVSNPPTEKPYDELKRALVSRTTASSAKRLAELLTATDLGDQTPSQLMRHMLFLRGDNTGYDDVVRHLFVQRLPAVVRTALSVHRTASLSELAELADLAMESFQQSVSAITTNAPETTTASAAANVDTSRPCSSCSAFQSDVASLTQEVAALRATRSFQNSRPWRSGSRRNPRDNSPRRQPGPYTLCWYHARFGHAATRCQPPCIFQGNAPTGK